VPVVVNQRKCAAQEQICKAIPACPNGAVRYEADEAAPLGGRIVIDERQCNECGACVQACCGQAIEVFPGADGTVNREELHG